MSSDRIEKRIELEAPLARVWRALTDHREFGEWFGVKMEGPFATGRRAVGNLTYPGYEHLKLEMEVEKMEPERLFSFRWHPYAIEPEVDYSQEPLTLVEFKLEKAGSRTLLTVVETGFDQLPAGKRRLDAFRMNESGWAEQMTNIQKHVRS